MKPARVLPTTRQRLWLRIVALVAIAGGVLLALILCWLKWHEDELVFATSLSHSRLSGQLPVNAERLTLGGASGAALAAVIFRAEPNGDSGYWVLHLHGNADSAFSPLQLEHSQRLTRMHLNVLSFDYRGFGSSPGVATEAHAYEDAEAAYQALRRRGVPADRIILWGHSLGSGPAVLLAVKHSAAALVLFGAFTSIPDAAADTFPLLPVRWLVGVQFDSWARLPRVHMPIVIAHSVGDLTIPFRHAERNYAAANEPKRLLTLDFPSADGYGGHVDALYDHLDLLAPQLRTLLRASF